MASLRQRMLEDMQIRNLAVNTQESYVQQVSFFARYFKQSPERLGPEQIRAYQVYLTNERKLATLVRSLSRISALSNSFFSPTLISLRRLIQPMRSGGLELREPKRPIFGRMGRADELCCRSVRRATA